MTHELPQLPDFLKNDDYLAIIIKQRLRPVGGEGEPIFPPTYPMPTYRGRVHTLHDGEYRVSVELPPFSQNGGKAEKETSKDSAGYNIDEFRDGSNVCEIDSPQSQANRIEPLFETIKGGKLVPQIRIKVGNKGDVINLLTAGHRAADAVVRFSSLVCEFHKAFTEVRKGNHLELAKLAPTSILFGVWDSRGTQVKLPRIIKSEIRATNVERLTRSAQFNPAIDFVQSGAVDESLNEKGEGDKNPLSAEGMKHVPAPRAAGGVIVRGEIIRVTRINLAALRDLRAVRDEKADTDETERLQRYLLGLALVAATRPLQLNLREGCLLCASGGEKAKPSIKAVKTDGNEDDVEIGQTAAENFAETAAKAFFGDRYDEKDHPEAIFESGVANKFLGMGKDDREKIERGGPITAEAIRQFEEKSKDPLKFVLDAVKRAKKTLPPRPRGRTSAPVIRPESFGQVVEQLEVLASDEQIDESVKGLVERLRNLIADDRNTSDTLKTLEGEIREFKKLQKAAGSPAELVESDSTERA